MTVKKHMKFMMRMAILPITITLGLVLFIGYKPNYCNQTLVINQQSKDVTADHDRMTMNSVKEVKSSDNEDNDAEYVVRNLRDEVRVLIAVLTSPANLMNRTLSVKQTWGKRCNKIIYFSTEENPSFPTVRLDVQEGYGHLTAKTIACFEYLYKHYINDFDWFMKADDDTYIIVENLLYYLSDKNFNEPVYFGDRFILFVKQGYQSGGPGYVLSKEALRLFGERNSSVNCRKDGGPEDVEMGICMEKLGVRIVDSVDAKNRSLFHSLTPEVHLNGSYPEWYYYYDAHQGRRKGKRSIGDYAISFHKITPENMRMLDFYVYKLKPYDVDNHREWVSN